MRKTYLRVPEIDPADKAYNYTTRRCNELEDKIELIAEYLGIEFQDGLRIVKNEEEDE